MNEVFNVLYDGYFQLWGFDGFQDTYNIITEYDDEYVRDPRLKALALETRRIYYICESFERYLEENKTAKEEKHGILVKYSATYAHTRTVLYAAIL